MHVTQGWATPAEGGRLPGPSGVPAMDCCLSINIQPNSKTSGIYMYIKKNPFCNMLIDYYSEVKNNNYFKKLPSILHPVTPKYPFWLQSGQ